MRTDLEDEGLPGIELDTALGVEALAKLDIERIKLEKFREQRKWVMQLRAMDDRRERDRRRYWLQLIVICSSVLVMVGMAVITYRAGGGAGYVTALTSFASLLCACVFPDERWAILRAGRRRAKQVARLSRKIADKSRSSRSGSSKDDHEPRGK